MIHTRLHKAMEADLVKKFEDIGSCIHERFSNCPHLVIDVDLQSIVKGPKIKEMIKSAMDGGVLKLSAGREVIEFRRPADGSNEKPVFICALSEYEGAVPPLSSHLPHFRADLLVIGDDQSKAIPILGACIRVNADGSFGINYGNSIHHRVKDNVEEMAAKAKALLGFGFSWALTYAIVISNARGIQKEVITCEKLNKNRRAKGQPLIRPYTLMRIGTVYKREKNLLGEDVDVGVRYHPGMPCHLRLGFTRRQWFGKGLTQEKMVYINPVVVNGTADDVEHRPRVVRK